LEPSAVRVPCGEGDGSENNTNEEGERASEARGHKKPSEREGIGPPSLLFIGEVGEGKKEKGGGEVAGLDPEVD